MTRPGSQSNPKSDEKNKSLHGPSSRGLIRAIFISTRRHNRCPITSRYHYPCSHHITVGVEWTGVCCPFDEHICLRVVISIRSFQSFLGSVKLAVGRRRHRSFRWIIAGLSADLTRTLPGKKSNFVDWCTLFLFRYYSIKLKEVFEWILKRNSWSCEKWKSLLHLVIHRQKIKIYIIILTTFVCKKHPQVTLFFFYSFYLTKAVSRSLINKIPVLIFGENNFALKSNENHGLYR